MLRPTADHVKIAAGLAMVLRVIPGLDLRPPRAVYDEAERQRLAMEPIRYLGNEGAKLREKWAAGLFGIGYEEHVAPCRVAVNDTKEQVEADFFLETDGPQPHAFQLAEKMDPARKRGDEYREIVAARARGESKLFHYDPEEGRRLGADWIAEAVASKAGKCYAGAECLHLVIFANFAAKELQHADLVAATAAFASTFASIWFLTDRHLATLHACADLGNVPGFGQIFPGYPELYF